MTFGVSNTGFVGKRLADVILELQTVFQDTFTANVDLSNDGPFGQLEGISADMATSIWELLDQVWLARSPNSASGIGLDILFDILKLPRLTLKPTITATVVTGTPTTSVAAGQLVAQTADTLQRFTNAEAFTLDGGGSASVSMVCAVGGPTLCLAGTLTSLISPPTGIATITNALDGSLGRNPESDDDYRVRRAGTFSTVRSSSAPGIVLRLLQVTGVLEVLLIQNLSASADVAGRPPHSIEAVVRGGADADLQAALWGVKPAGIKTVGNVSGTIIDARGDSQESNFSRATRVPVYITANLTVTKAFPTNGVARIIAAFVQYGGTLQINRPVAPFALESACVGIPGILEMQLLLGRLPGPSAEDPLSMGQTEIAVLDSTRMLIGVTHV